jgi:glucosamine-6-phosphate deaminase
MAQKGAQLKLCWNKVQKGAQLNLWNKGAAGWKERQPFVESFIKTIFQKGKESVRIFPDEGNELAIEAAKIIAEKIRENNRQGEKTVLGLATGNTPLDVYRELIRLHNEEGLDFSNVVTFNLDEYYGLEKTDVNSYYRFMWENFFEHINISKENVHIPDGTIARRDLKKYCKEYERAIKDAGGIDIQILGIGRDGHIGFNEPGSSIDSRTRLIALDGVTREDALPDFGERKYVPKEAITMGVATILEAKQIILMATGEHKAHIICEAVEGPVTASVAASYLQNHENTKIFLDRAAASELAQVKTPWVFGDIDWSNKAVRLKAVCYLSEKLKRSINNLGENDFRDNSLASLLQSCNLEELKSFAINKLKGKIKDHDGLPRGKTIIIFSPHPDDDIISMGGTLRKLVENGNKVIVIYMTPGNTAVFDHAVKDFIISRKEFSKAFNSEDKNKMLYRKVLKFLAKKSSSNHGMVDAPEVLEIKKIIRKTEAISCCSFVGVKSYEFLNLPFYQTGRARKMPVGSEDIKIVKRAIEEYKPDIIFAAGDLTDPNGTHRLCLSAIRRALKALHVYENHPDLWLFSGAWTEFHPADADVLIPLTQQEISLKRTGIFRHESQKDTAPQPGHMKGEFWQMAEKRNAATAELLENYGIEGYRAMEAFKISAY